MIKRMALYLCGPASKLLSISAVFAIIQSRVSQKQKGTALATQPFAPGKHVAWTPGIQKNNSAHKKS